jgi:hypothetical protein
MYTIEWQEGPRGPRFGRRWEPEPWEVPGVDIPEVEERLDLDDIPTGKYDDILFSHIPLPDPYERFSMAQTHVVGTPERQNTVDVTIRTTGLSDIKAAFYEETGRRIVMAYGQRTIRSYDVGDPDEFVRPWQPDLIDLSYEELGRLSRRPVMGEDPVSVAYYKALKAYGLDPYEEKPRWWDVVNWEEYVERSRTWQWANPNEVRELK